METFISHKHEDKHKALALAKHLRTFAPGSHIFVSEEIPKGKKWRDALYRALDHSQ